MDGGGVGGDFAPSYILEDGMVRPRVEIFVVLKRWYSSGSGVGGRDGGGGGGGGIIGGKTPPDLD